MQTFLFATNVAFMIAGTAVGLRLLLLARKTRQIPELLIGTSLFIGGGVNVPLWWIEGSGALTGNPLLMVGVALNACVAATGSLILVAVWRIFHPRRAGAAVLAALTFVLLCLRAVPESQDLVRSQSFVWWSEHLSIIFVYVWMTVESLRHARALRRRQRLGLRGGSTVLVRMVLWAIGMAAIALLYTSLMVIEGVTEVSGPTVAGAAFAVGFGGLTCSVCLSLAFFTPKALLSRFSAETLSRKTL